VLASGSGPHTNQKHDKTPAIEKKKYETFIKGLYSHNFDAVATFFAGERLSGAELIGRIIPTTTTTTTTTTTELLYRSAVGHFTGTRGRVSVPCVRARFNK